MQSARGQYLGGGAIRAGTRYGQEMGSQEYMNAFNRAQALLGNRLGALGSLYGAGQTATQQVAGQAGQMGANVGNLLMQGGQARASGYLGQANALSQALGQGAMGYGLYKGGYFGAPGGVGVGSVGPYGGSAIPYTGQYGTGG
jgi:PPE-repeat protein